MDECDVNKRIGYGFENNNKQNWIKFPYTITDVSKNVNDELLQNFTGERTGFVQVGPKKWFFPSGYQKNAEFYYNFQARCDDVWIVTFPRSGTTWTQEMVWLLANDLDFETAKKVPLEFRFPFLEFSSFVHPEVKNEFLKENSSSAEKCDLIEEMSTPAWKFFEETSERRFIKTHLPFDLLPPDLLQVGCKIILIQAQLSELCDILHEQITLEDKVNLLWTLHNSSSSRYQTVESCLGLFGPLQHRVIYVARNPKDVIVSFYHLNHLFRTQGYVGDFPRYWQYFKNNLQPWTPYFSHIQEGWERRNEENVLFMFYEDMGKNLDETIKKTSTFLGRRYDSQDVCRLTEHLKIENFRNNKRVNGETFKELGIILDTPEGFVRKGQNGGWKNYFTGTLNLEVDDWIDENLKNNDFQFPHII